MTPLIYNLSLLTGLLLTCGGVALVSIPSALVVAGVSVIALTIMGARR